MKIWFSGEYRLGPYRRFAISSGAAEVIYNLASECAPPAEWGECEIRLDISREGRELKVAICPKSPKIDGEIKIYIDQSRFIFLRMLPHPSIPLCMFLEGYLFLTEEKEVIKRIERNLSSLMRATQENLERLEKL